ncbi:MAG: hypothetical protein ACNA7I_09440, partial [Candidatus Methanoperedens sp.]
MIDKKNKPFLSTVITLVIITMLVISGPAHAVLVGMNASDLDNRIVGDTGFFYINMTIGANERIPIASISVENLPDISGSPGGKLVFNVSDFENVGDNVVNGSYNISLIERYGWVGGPAGSGYDNNSPVPPYNGSGPGYSFTGYGYGYGYGYGNPGTYTSLKYKITMDTAGAEAGTYNVTANVNTGQSVVFKGESSFTLLPSTIQMDIDINPDRINPGSKGVIKVTIFNNTPEGFDVASINVSSVRFGEAEVVKSENPANKL